MVYLTHPAVGDIRRFNWSEILCGVSTLKGFETGVNRDWRKYLDTLNLDLHETTDCNDAERRRNRFFGDAFEVFTEMLLLTQGFDRSGVAQYKPLNFLEGQRDIGIDGTGIGNNGKPATVQVKFRSNPTVELFAKEDGLSGFVAASQNVYNVDVADKYNMTVVTNCIGINQKSKDVMLFGKVRCIGRAQIQDMVDRSNPWWDDFRAATAPVTKPQPKRTASLLD